MALTVTEANAVNRLIDHLTGHATVIDTRVTRRDAIDHLVLLAEHAYKTLSAGYTGADARQTLTEYWPVPTAGLAASPAPRPAAKPRRAAMVLCARCHAIRAEVPVPDGEPICIYCAEKSEA
ncbi:MAG TPA: hypothetical protein VGM10_31095 [Actinocrinis sp.]|jgi:hypothetical protein